MKMLISRKGNVKKLVSILSDEFCEEQVFPYLRPKGKFVYNVLQDILITPTRYFNHWLLKFNQYFTSYTDYIIFARSVYEQHHLRLSINSAMQKINPCALTAGMVKK